MGREPEKKVKQFSTPVGEIKSIEVELFTWEKTDYISKVKEVFGLNSH